MTTFLKIPDAGSSNAPYRLYNIGNNQPVKLLDYIEALEKAMGKTAEKEFLPMQPGDVQKIYADLSADRQACLTASRFTCR